MSTGPAESRYQYQIFTEIRSAMATVADSAAYEDAGRIDPTKSGCLC